MGSPYFGKLPYSSSEVGYRRPAGDLGKARGMTQDLGSGISLQKVQKLSVDTSGLKDLSLGSRLWALVLKSAGPRAYLRSCLCGTTKKVS